MRAYEYIKFRVSSPRSVSLAVWTLHVACTLMTMTVFAYLIKHFDEPEALNRIERQVYHISGNGLTNLNRSPCRNLVVQVLFEVRSVCKSVSVVAHPQIILTLFRLLFSRISPYAPQFCSFIVLN